MSAAARHGAMGMVLALALVGGGGGGRAQEGLARAAETPAQREALEHLEAGLLVSARTDAERALRERPDSLIGHYVLGRSLYEADGSLARALRHLGRAREIYETRWRPGDPAGGPTQLHQELLFTTARLAGEMELHGYQLELLGYYDHLYEPDLIAARCWPLMKLGRMEEARRFARVAVESPDLYQRSAGLNALCALEGEARRRVPYADACLEALSAAREEARASPEPTPLTVDAYNAALAAAAALRMEAAVGFAQEGAARLEPTPANPWRLLTELHLSQGRDDLALEALRGTIRWNDRQPASLRDQSRADLEATVAQMLWVAGDAETALVRIERAMARPDRRGLTTDSAETARGRHALLRLLIRRTLEEQRAEEASWRGLVARLGHRLARPFRSLATWPDAERVRAVLMDEDRLVDTVRPYGPGGLDGLSPWLTGELIGLLGPAVVRVALRRAERLDADVAAEVRPFYLALDAELAAAEGDAEQAVASARRVIAALPEREERVVARAAAVAARAADRAGRRREANELFEVALAQDPGVLRRLGMRLPVTVHAEGPGMADARADLEVSPRFRRQRGAFRLELMASGSSARGCLRSSRGHEIRCAEVRRGADAPGPEEGAAEPADPPLTLGQTLVRELHAELFSPHLELDRIDLSGLDGRTIGGSRRANERLREVLDPPAP